MMGPELLRLAKHNNGSGTEPCQADNQIFVYARYEGDGSTRNARHDFRDTHNQAATEDAWN